MDRIEELEAQALQDVAAAATTGELEDIDVKYLGRAKGRYSELMKLIPSLSNEEKPTFGKRVNEAKARLLESLETRRAELAKGEMEKRLAHEALDVTLPSRPPRSGYQHVLTLTEDRIRSALTGLGFEFVDGPELEEYRYNFDALNYPADHPAMDEQNSFWVDDKHVLRTQTTALQGRTFENRTPPMRIATVGRCFRYEAVDATHSFAFHQVDAFTIERDVSMAHLKGTLGAFARAMFGPQVKVRFRPDFFPFVEPGVDYSISCFFCSGSGCGVCRRSGWIELGGAGLVHPNILESYGFDPEEWSGFAFGLGVERIPMLQFRVDDIRLFLENNLQFLAQFVE